MKIVAKSKRPTNKPISCLKKLRDALELNPQPLYERFAEWSFLWTTATKKSKPKKIDRTKTIANIRQQIARFDRVDPLKKQCERLDREKQFRAYVHACIFIWLSNMDIHKEAESDKNESLLDKEIENFQNKSKAFRNRYPEDYKRQHKVAEKQATENFKRENDASDGKVKEGFNNVISALKDLQEEKKGFNIFPLKFIFQRIWSLNPQRTSDIVVIPATPDVVEVPFFNIIKMYEDNEEFYYILRRLLFNYCNTGAIADFIAQLRHLDGDVLWLIEFMEKNPLPLFNYIAEKYPTKKNLDPKKINLEYMSIRHMDIDVLRAKKKLSKREKSFLLELYLKDIQTNLHYVQQILDRKLFHTRAPIEPTEGIINLELLHSMNAGVLKLMEEFFSINGMPPKTSR